MTPDTPRHAAMEPQDAAFGARVRTLSVCSAEAWAIDGERETLVATLQGTMMCLQGRGVSG